MGCGVRRCGNRSHSCRPALILSATPDNVPVMNTRDELQRQVLAWAEAAFGTEQARSLPQRSLRLLEEAIDAYQACDGDDEIRRRDPGVSRRGAPILNEGQ